MIVGMTKRRISATVDPDRLAEAADLVAEDNVSAVLDLALLALIDQERERRWLAAHPPLAPDDAAGGESGLLGAVAPDLSDLPWDDSA